MTTPLSFWVWFFRGRAGEAGWRRVVNSWLILHVVVGVTVSWLVPVRLDEAAKAVLLPLVGVFVAMSFAWVGTAYAIVQTEEIDALAEQHPGGIESYVFPFQTAILILLVALTAWGLAGLGVYDRKCLMSCPAWGYSAISAGLFGLGSLTIRECWHVVLGSQMLLLYQRAIRKMR